MSVIGPFQLVLLQKQQQIEQALAEQKLREQMDKARAEQEEVQLDRIKNKRTDQQSKCHKFNFK